MRYDRDLEELIELYQDMNLLERAIYWVMVFFIKLRTWLFG